MSTDYEPPLRPDLSVETTASQYDRVNAMLLAAIMLFGFLFSVLFLIWLTSIVDFSRRTTGPIVEVADEPGDEKPKGEEDDVLEPGVEEFPEVETPQLANALEAVTDAVSSVRASLEKRSGSAAQMGRGRGVGSRDGGPGSGGNGIPEYKRWIISYESPDIQTYAEQLSFLKVDIGVVGQTKPDIVRVRDPAQAKTLIRSDRKTENAAKSLYFMHKKERLKRWDRDLCRQAGETVDDDELTVQFYPEETRQMIRLAEATALQGTGKKVQDVKNTFIKVEPDGNNGYKFTVTDILYR